MPINFKPIFTITPKILAVLLRIESVKQAICDLPITPTLLMTLRETARLYSTHYSTMIEGNRLTQEEVERVVKKQEHFPGRERDEKEVKGYYAALDYIEKLVAKSMPITEKIIQTLHAYVMNNGKTNVKPTSYRDGQNVIRDSTTKQIVYLPPEAKDVSALMNGLVKWIKESTELPCPLVAAHCHYQFATIHPYYDGNGRTARLLTTFLLHVGGYGLKGLYSLEEYYAQNLPAYYEALSVGPSHNYYMGRAEADITKWVEYFCQGMAESFEKVLHRTKIMAAPGVQDQSSILRSLDVKQRKALELFQRFETITAKQIGELFGFKPRTATQLCHKWVEHEFLVVVDESRKGRKYQLANNFKKLGTIS